YGDSVKDKPPGTAISAEDREHARLLALQKFLELAPDSVRLKMVDELLKTKQSWCENLALQTALILIQSLDSDTRKSADQALWNWLNGAEKDSQSRKELLVAVLEDSRQIRSSTEFDLLVEKVLFDEYYRLLQNSPEGIAKMLEAVKQTKKYPGFEKRLQERLNDLTRKK
ncbi:MAG: hypothetical protein K2Z81_08805, partial [Cyanobacteria bacterium]|nr:hypothetical protein [Cyanobacteriota bacterium]